MGIHTFKWDMPDNIHIAFGGPEFNLVEKANRVGWLKQLEPSIPSWVAPLQQHGAKVMDQFVVSDTMENKCDGFVSSNAELGLAVLGSDCPGVAIWSERHIGVAHCGWRGIQAGIVRNLIELIRAREPGAPDALKAFIGPGICQRCYLVRDDLLEKLGWPHGHFTPVPQTSQYELNLTSLISKECKQAGINEVMSADICTHCHPRLHSYRYQGPGTIQVLAVWRLQQHARAAKNTTERHQRYRYLNKSIV